MRDLGPDIDPIESREWQDAIADVIERDGPNRAHFLLDKAVAQARAAGATLPFSATTPHPTLSETVNFAAEMFEGTITDLIPPKKRH